MAQTDFDLLIDFQNDGNKEGVLEIQIVTWIGDEASSPVTYTCPFGVQPGEDTRWRISMDQFPNAAINVSYVILDMNNQEIGSIDSFNVAKFAESDEGPYIAYVSQQNLLKDDSNDPCSHPQIEAMFDDIEGRYVLKKENIH